jgi:hypothetical protein
MSPWPFLRSAESKCCASWTRPVSSWTSPSSAGTATGSRAVDVFFDSTPFVASVLERRVQTDLGLGPIYLCTAADVLLFKLIAYRHKDRADIENILTIQGVPERAYLEAWAAKLGMRERLEESLRELGLS